MTATTTAPAVTYTTAEGTAYEGKQAEQIAAWEADLLSGRVFALAANGHASRFGYQPPATACRYAQIMTTLGQYAASSDQRAYVASRLMRVVNLYGTDAQQATALYREAAAIISEQYEDVIGATGPEAGRPSSHRHDWTIFAVMGIYRAIRKAIGETGEGWCCAAVARAHQIPAWV